MLKKSLIIFCVFLFSHSLLAPVFPSSLMPAYIYEIGLKFYQQGRYEEALHEFKKALLVDPDFEPALKYIELIKANNPVAQNTRYMQPVMVTPAQEEITIPSALIPAPPARTTTKTNQIDESLLMFEKQAPAVTPSEEMAVEAAPGIIMLDQSLKQILQPIEIEQGRSILLRGSNIQRFLLTQPQTIAVEKSGPNELTLTGKQLGYTYLHVWDDSGRTTLEFFTAPPRPQGTTLEEQMLEDVQRQGNFKLRYYMDWNSYFSGRRLDTLERQFYSFNHTVSLNGATPYGDLDSTVVIRRQPHLTDIPYYTLGLEKGRYSFLNDFSLRFFDFTPGISNQMFSNVYLRGVNFKTPVFHKLLDYTVFWGKDKVGTYGNLSSGAKTKDLDSFLSGARVNLNPSPKQNYHASVFRGWGSDRKKADPDLNEYGYDAGFGIKFKPWGLSAETAYDSQHFGNLAALSYNVPKLSLFFQGRDIDRDFHSMTGLGSRAGELGLLSLFTYIPTEKIRMNGQLDVFRDRLSPSLENENRWNENLNWSTTYAFDPTMSATADCIFQNELGRLSEIRYFSPGLGLNKSFPNLRKLSTFLNYRYQHNQNFTSPGIDYENYKISTGLRFSLAGNLFYFLRHEFNWLTSLYDGTTSQPYYRETGLDWTGQIFGGPVKLYSSFLYHDEEDTIAPLSFLSGEDYIEGYAEFTYPFSRSGETYISTRVRNIWADNPVIAKNFDAELRGGIRYTWDTGVRWEGVGTIEGYVFRDLNSDGLRQNNEPPMQNITLWLGLDKYAVSDEFGFYKFEHIKGKGATVMLDTSTLPAGYVLTVPVSQDSLIIHHGRSRLDFGLISRTEISGVVFEDVNNDTAFSKADKPVKGVRLSLENGTKAVSNEVGKFIFTNAAPGAHTISLDINSVPVYYLPKVPLNFDLILSEAVPYQYNIPLKKTKE